MTEPVDAGTDGHEHGVEEGRRTLEPGTKVEVRSRLDSRRWGKGFRVHAVTEDGYVLVRTSDGSTMPVTFPFGDVRQERKRGTWWY